MKIAKRLDTREKNWSVMGVGLGGEDSSHLVNWSIISLPPNNGGGLDLVKLWKRSVTFQMDLVISWGESVLKFKCSNNDGLIHVDSSVSLKTWRKHNFFYSVHPCSNRMNWVVPIPIQNEKKNRAAVGALKRKGAGARDLPCKLNQQLR